jgi:hypothetical protein
MKLDDVEAGDALLFQQRDRMGLGLARTSRRARSRRRPGPLPELWTCIIARWSTRRNPSVCIGS